MSAAHVPGCSGKPRYGDEATALAATQRGRDREWTKGGKKKTPLFAYRCEACGWWHLTHMSPEEHARGVRIANWRKDHARPLWERVRDRMPKP